MDVAVCRKRELFKICKQSRNEEDWKKYCETKKDAKGVVYMAMDQKAWEAVEKVALCCNGHELFRIAKHRVGVKKDNVGLSCINDESGAVKVWMIERKSLRSIQKSWWMLKMEL